jgi:hypothetical protein
LCDCVLLAAKVLEKSDLDNLPIHSLSAQNKWSSKGKLFLRFGGAAIPKKKSGAVGASTTTAEKKPRYRYSPSPLTRLRLVELNISIN